MSETERTTGSLGTIGSYLLVLVALAAPFAPYWYLQSGVRGSFGLPAIAVVAVVGAGALLAGASLVGKYTDSSAESVLVVGGLPLGFNAGSLLGEWSGISERLTVFLGLAGALVSTLWLLALRDRIP
ncbi:hypothetical protein [Halorussus pelagicus]|uniref:hypothetical protein n=1 Tax=Halorussus pelagicus TaxID=2505977 RepID=UPI000FFBD873|nr:hypothetical protein [Halorussus pelagicus]